VSKITTRSVFYFGTVVELNTRSIDFSEDGVTELQATLNIKDYSLTEYAAEIQRAFRAAGTQAYVVTVNRTTRILTISAPLAFEIWTDTGSRAGTAAYATMGLSTVSDYTGANNYNGASGAGLEYQTQYPVDRYVSEEDSMMKENATYNTTPVTIVQMVSFADGSRIEMNIRLITNLTGLKNDPFFSNINGVPDFRSFIRVAMRKNRLEFMPDVANRSNFVKVILEGTSEDRNGLRFQLKNMGTPEYFESGVLSFRKVLV